MNCVKKTLEIKYNNTIVTDVVTFTIRENNKEQKILEIICKPTSNLLNIVDGDADGDEIEISFGDTKILFKNKEFGACCIKYQQYLDDLIIFYDSYGNYEVI